MKRLLVWGLVAISAYWAPRHSITDHRSAEKPAGQNSDAPADDEPRPAALTKPGSAGHDTRLHPHTVTTPAQPHHAAPKTPHDHSGGLRPAPHIRRGK